MPGWVLHDFRRLLSTTMHDQGVPPHIVEAILGHAGGHKAGSAAYNRALYLDERRRALERWAAFVEETVDRREAGHHHQDAEEGPPWHGVIDADRSPRSGAVDLAVAPPDGW